MQKTREKSSTMANKIWHPSLSHLLDELAAVFDRQNDAKRIVKDVGLDSRNINWDQNARNFWLEIIEEAQQLNKVENLIKETTELYPESSELRVAVDEYRVWINQRKSDLLDDVEILKINLEDLSKQVDQIQSSIEMPTSPPFIVINSDVREPISQFKRKSEMVGNSNTPLSSKPITKTNIPTRDPNRIKIENDLSNLFTNHPNKIFTTQQLERTFDLPASDLNRALEDLEREGKIIRDFSKGKIGYRKNLKHQYEPRR